MRLAALLMFLATACSKPAQPIASPSELTAARSGEILAAIRSGAAPGPGEEPGSAPGCADFLAQHAGFTAGTLEVPEDWAQPGGARIRVFYYWRKGSDDKRVPVVFFNGGPAESSHAAVDLLAALPAVKKTTFVFLDQRGTGCSSPFPGATDEASAARLMHWGSESIVRDAEALRTHLFGSRRWRAFGQSYGGLIVHRYLELAPASLDRAVVHGSSVMSDPVAWLTERMRAQSRVAEAYFSRYPADRTALANARAAIPASRCWTSGASHVCGPAVLDSLAILLGYRDSWPTLHDWIGALHGADGEIDAATLDGLVSTYVFGVYAAAGMGGNVISKMEIVPGFSDRDGCDAVTKRLEAAGEHPAVFDVNECRLLLALDMPGEALLAAVRPRPVSVAKIGANLGRVPARFYLFSGGQDVFVPVASFAEETKLLGHRVRYENFPQSGHEGYYSEPDVLAAVGE